MKRNLRCESCGKDAEFTVYRVSQTGRHGERNLCSACTRDNEHLLFGTHSLSLTDLLETLLAERNAPSDKQNRTKVCPDCGNNVNEIIESGFVGCPACYVVFREEVDRVVSALHGRQT